MKTVLICVLLAQLSCASWVAKKGRWFTAEETAICNAEKVDPAAWRKMHDWQGVPKPAYDKVQDAWAACQAASVEVARDNLNAIEANEKYQATWIPVIQNTIEAVAYVAILAGIFVLSSNAGPAAPAVFAYLVRFIQ